MGYFIDINKRLMLMTIDTTGKTLVQIQREVALKVNKAIKLELKNIEGKVTDREYSEISDKLNTERVKILAEYKKQLEAIYKRQENLETV